MKGKYLLLGTNLGDRKKNLSSACASIEKYLGKIIRKSSIYESDAWGFHDQPYFYNQVVKIKTILSPEELLKRISHIEKNMGRIRQEKWKERLIDIDILYYDNKIINDVQLVIPHPEIQNRKFTLVPLCEISPHELHPVFKKTNLQLLEGLTDPLGVKKI
jgi:2-amino-4-hydroxy-6-hydroxymethyldihydropteridine diphosphokinase